MKGIYYGAGRNVIGPYHADETRARLAAQEVMKQSGNVVYHIEADSYQNALRMLLNKSKARS